MSPVKSPFSPCLLLGMQHKTSELNTIQEQKEQKKALWWAVSLSNSLLLLLYLPPWQSLSQHSSAHTHSLREQQGSNSNLCYKSQGTAPPDSATIIKKGVSQIFLKKYRPVQRSNIGTPLALTLVRTHSVHTFLSYCFSVSKTCKMVLYLLISSRSFWTCRINSVNCLSGRTNTLIKREVCYLWHLENQT